MLLGLTIAGIGEAGHAEASVPNGYALSQAVNARQLPDALKTEKHGTATAVHLVYGHDPGLSPGQAARGRATGVGAFTFLRLLEPAGGDHRRRDGELRQWRRNLRHEFVRRQRHRH